MLFFCKSFEAIGKGINVGVNVTFLVKIVWSVYFWPVTQNEHTYNGAKDLTCRV